MNALDAKAQHLEMIQGVVSRLAGNTFLIKGWSITLVTAVLALAVQQKDGRIAFVGLLPILVLAGLDAYYLRLERMFRCLYESVDQDAATDASAFTMNAARFRDELQCRWRKVSGSMSLVGLYAPLALACLAAGLLLQ